MKIYWQICLFVSIADYGSVNKELNIKKFNTRAYKINHNNLYFILYKLVIRFFIA